MKVATAFQLLSTTITVDWFARQIAVFAEHCPGTLDSEHNRRELAQHLWGNMAQIVVGVERPSS